VFEWHRREFAGRDPTGQLRSSQRGIRHLRATEGPDEEVIFPREDVAGRLCASDFTQIKSLEIMIARVELQGADARHRFASPPILRSTRCTTPSRETWNKSPCVANQTPSPVLSMQEILTS
jgi:hypothetical protein